MRYFFHIIQGGSRVEDTDGLALPSDEQARREAARSLTDYLSELSFSSDQVQQVAIQVEREDGGFATLVSCQVDFLKAC